MLSSLPVADRIPLPQKLAFGAGASMDYVATGLLTGVFWMPYFNIGLGLSPALLSTVLMLLQIWNAITDPIMGNWSDNARTRWGRRRPFIFAGAILTGVMYVLIWRVPINDSPFVTGCWLTLAGIGFFTCFSSWAMPYYSMQLELTPDYDERTRLMAWITFFGKITGLVTGWAMALVSCRLFADEITGKPDIVHGIKTTSWFLAVLIVGIGLLPALFVRERYYEAETSRQARDPFWQSIRESARCRPLWMLIGISFFFVLGSVAVGTLGQYINIYYVMDGRVDDASLIAGWKSTAVFLTGILTIPLWTKLGERYDKKTMVAVMLGFSVFGHLLNLVCLTPEHPYLQIIPSVFESGAIGAVWLFLPSMKADAADSDELHTARRREGSLNAFYSWFIKAALACSVGLGGLMLEFTGFSAKIEHQAPEVLHRMFVLYLVAPTIIWGIAFIFIKMYPLNRDNMREIRAALEARRGRL